MAHSAWFRIIPTILLIISGVGRSAGEHDAICAVQMNTELHSSVKLALHAQESINQASLHNAQAGHQPTSKPACLFSNLHLHLDAKEYHPRVYSNSCHGYLLNVSDGVVGQRLLPQIGFNPSIVALPLSITNSLDANVTFLAVFRTTFDLCELGGAKAQGFHVPDKNHTRGEATLAFLDADFNVLASRKFPGEGEDVRLLVYNDTVLVSANMPRWVWFLKTLNLPNAGHGLQATLDGAFVDDHDGIKFHESQEPFLHEGVESDDVGDPYVTKGSEKKQLWDSVSARHKAIGKNLGLFGGIDSLQLLWWTDASLQVHTRPGDLKHVLWYHNNIHPVELPQENAYLGIVHDMGDANQWVDGVSGSTYLHRFILFENKPPWRTKSASKWFCMPSLSPKHQNTCESIQFIVSAILDPHDPSTMLISYGALDCEPAIVRAPFAAILASLIPVHSQQP